MTEAANKLTADPAVCDAIHAQVCELAFAVDALEGLEQVLRGSGEVPAPLLAAAVEGISRRVGAAYDNLDRLHIATAAKVAGREPVQ
ncbi:hypothetical protein WDZ92_49060 [Nostoc sp. NIES-2111]